LKLLSISYLKRYILFTIFVYSLPLSAQTTPVLSDTIGISYNDFYSYSQLNGILRYSPGDSLSSLQLAAKTSATYYPESFKSNSDFQVRYLQFYNHLQAGIRFYGLFSNDKLISLPASGNMQLIPEIGYNSEEWKVSSGIGYAAKREENRQNEGYKLFLDGAFTPLSGEYAGSNFSVLAEHDNLDSNSNYNIAASGSYLQNWNDISLTTEARSDFQSYHQNVNNSQTNIQRKANRINAIMQYQLTNQTVNRFSLLFEQRDKSAPDNPSISRNQSVLFGFSDQLFYVNEFYDGSWRLEYKNSSENFTYSEKEDSYTDYLYQFSTENAFFVRDFTFSVGGRYYKSSLEGKKINEQISAEDRDIVQLALTPQISWRYNSILKLYQSVPLDYYHLINISASRSANNRTDRGITSISGWQYTFLPGWQNKGSVIFKTLYQAYDYSGDIAGINSFLVKENSISDSLEWQIADKSLLSLQFRYSYDEFGYLNWQQFTTQPITHSRGYLAIGGYTFQQSDKHKLRLEYIFHESDKFRHDTDDINKSYLSEVYIQQGPRLTGNLSYKKIDTELQAAYYFYRFNRRELTFNLKAGYKI